VGGDVGIPLIGGGGGRRETSFLRQRHFLLEYKIVIIIRN
jgi:hypothetical protein